MRHNKFFSLNAQRVLYALALFSWLLPGTLKGQDTTVIVNDTTPIIDTTILIVDTTLNEEHSAKKASLYSMALPGLGQAYNRKYWKIPVIYAGFGVLGYNIHVNNAEMKLFTEAYRYRIRNDSTPTDNKYVAKYKNPDDLLRGRDFYQRRLELSVLLTAAWYILNIVDAAVDAHFFDYDVSEDISLNIRPVYIPPKEGNPLGSPGLRLCMKF